MATIITIVITFIAAGIDEMLVLILLFAHAKNKKQMRQVYIGQQAGMTVILFIILIALYGVSFFTGKWTGLLGILPIVIGLMELFDGDEDEESDAILRKTTIFSNLTTRVAIVAIVGGSEELAIFVPYFTTLNSNELMIAVLTFFVMIFIWSGICHVLGSTKNVYKVVKRYERIIIPVVFIGIGMKVLLENDTIETILDLFL
ncbi:cadmium resistance transporter [Ornithinibacillus californiensis]|uniref:cadmium resistance transporter n=1 Tax=Ornithinibacillus californiensis TaxID=161536 RepID=UPI00064DC4E9|nr:cadmium resistance transporter [Ornithinibacillus californiensis]